MTVKEVLAESHANRWHLFVQTETELIRLSEQIEKEPVFLGCETVTSLCTVLSWKQYQNFLQTVKEDDFFISEPRTDTVLVLAISKEVYENAIKTTLITSSEKRYIDCKIRKETPIGYCHYPLHKGYINESILRKHECIGKHCNYLQKNFHHPYWKKREERKKMRKDRKEKWKEFLRERKLPLKQKSV